MSVILSLCCKIRRFESLTCSPVLIIPYVALLPHVFIVAINTSWLMTDHALSSLGGKLAHCIVLSLHECMCSEHVLLCYQSTIIFFMIIKCIILFRL
jgi:hypothetical protein